MDSEQDLCEKGGEEDVIASNRKSSQGDHSELPNESSSLFSSPKIVLRPSGLTKQTEKLKILSTLKTDSLKAETKPVSQKEDSLSKTDSQNVHNDGVTGNSSIFSNPMSTKHFQSSTSAESAFGLFSSNSCKEQNNRDTGGFVFGQNLHERAANYENVAKTEKSTVPDSKPCLSFDLLQKEDKTESVGEKNNNDDTGGTKRSLSDAAKEYESKRMKTILEEVSVVTGEEGESNVLQINCKLYAFDNEKKSWLERSRGILRLNDHDVDGVSYSRVVMRTQGSLRVVLNSKVWPGMTVEHPSEKTVRLTAIDVDGVKVFLIMTTAIDASKLFRALEIRITRLKYKEQKLTDSEVCESSSNNSASHSNTSVSSEFYGFPNSEQKNASVLVAEESADKSLSDKEDSIV